MLILLFRVNSKRLSTWLAKETRNYLCQH